MGRCWVSFKHGGGVREVKPRGNSMDSNVASMRAVELWSTRVFQKVCILEERKSDSSRRDFAIPAWFLNAIVH